MTPSDIHEDDDAAERKHADRMLAIYLRLEAIDDERRNLRDEADGLREEIVSALGVRLGDIVTHRNERVMVASRPIGEFFFLSDDADDKYRVVARVTFSAAPETKDGNFHSRTRKARSVMDDTVIEVPKAVQL